MMFTFTSNGMESMPALSATPIKKADSLRPLAVRPGSSPSTLTPKFAKSALNKERDRLLKKYSPMKKRNKRKLSNSTKRKDESSIDIHKPRLVHNLFNQAMTLILDLIHLDFLLPCRY